MAKTLNLTARLTSDETDNKSIEKKVNSAISEIDGVMVNKLNITNLNPSQTRIIRASLDLMLEKVNQQDELAEESLNAYSLTGADIDEKSLSELINTLFP